MVQDFPRRTHIHSSGQNILLEVPMFRSGAAEDSVLPGYDIASVGNRPPTFLSHKGAFKWHPIYYLLRQLPLPSESNCF
jgi:hypothetical protein